jgi:hypothetical protein
MTARWFVATGALRSVVTDVGYALPQFGSPGSPLGEDVP